MNNKSKVLDDNLDVDMISCANSTFNDAEFVIIGSKHEFEGDNTNCSLGAEFIRKASYNFESYDIFYDQDLSSVKISDEGDYFGDELVCMVHDTIYAGKIPIVIGGSHASTIVAKTGIEKRGNWIVMDAHSDFYDEYNDSDMSHACVSRNIHNSGESLGVFGMRDCSQEHYNIMKSSNFIHPATMEDIHKYGIKECYNSFRDICDVNNNLAYVSIDLDVLDPSIAPSVGTSVPNGLQLNQVFDILRYTNANMEIGYLDINELTHISSKLNIKFTADVAYKILVEAILGIKFSSNF